MMPANTPNPDPTQSQVAANDWADREKSSRRLLALTVYEIHLAEGTANALWDADIHDVGDLLGTPVDVLLAVRNVGKAALHEIWGSLALLAPEVRCIGCTDEDYRAAELRKADEEVATAVLQKSTFTMLERRTHDVAHGKQFVQPERCHGAERTRECATRDAEIIRRANAGERRADIARHFSLTKSHISRIIQDACRGKKRTCQARRSPAN